MNALPLLLAVVALSGGRGNSGGRTGARPGSGPSDREVAQAAGATVAGVGCGFIPVVGMVAAPGCAVVGGWLGGELFDWW